MTRILFATSEVYPLVKTGGLADVSGSLPEALCHIGNDVQLLLPGYPAALTAIRDLGSECKARLTVDGYDVELWKGELPGTRVAIWLVDCPPLFDRPGNPYQDASGEDWRDNPQRFYVFARVAALMALGEAGISWIPEIVHCNDWQSALIPALLAPSPRRPGTLFTIHNLAYQGLFSRETFNELGLDESLWHFEKLEFHGQMSFIKGGLVFSDRITTVSPEYAREIRTPEYGYGLDGLLRHRQDRLSGILNGIDTSQWDPQTDPHLSSHYRAQDIRGKVWCRTALCKELSLDSGKGPILGFIGRLVEQKGVDWLLDVIPPLLERGCRFVVLGSGEARYEEPLKRLARDWPGRLSLTIGYNEGLAHRITAGCHIFVMPSRFEPCGLNQMYSLHYGTLPVVHSVGGLKDTVFDPLDVSMEQANGFCFREPGSEALLAAIERALEYLERPANWRQLQRNAMAGDYSWARSAVHYADLYQRILAERQAV